MTKYHSKRVEAAGHLFDSRAERDFYLLCLLPLKQSDIIAGIEFQPKYELQPAFRKDGKKYRPIYYIADFEVTYRDGTVDIIDVKGFETPVFKLKQKLFEYKYPGKRIKCVKKSRNFASFMNDAIIKHGEKGNGKKKD
jgi:hypothetical protein